MGTTPLDHLVSCHASGTSVLRTKPHCQVFQIFLLIVDSVTEMQGKTQLSPRWKKIFYFFLPYKTYLSLEHICTYKLEPLIQNATIPHNPHPTTGTWEGDAVQHKNYNTLNTALSMSACNGKALALEDVFLFAPKVQSSVSSPMRRDPQLQPQAELW